MPVPHPTHNRKSIQSRPGRQRPRHSERPCPESSRALTIALPSRSSKLTLSAISSFETSIRMTSFFASTELTGACPAGAPCRRPLRAIRQKSHRAGCSSDPIVPSPMKRGAQALGGARNGYILGPSTAQMARPLNTHRGSLAGDASWGSEPAGGKTVRHRVLLVEDHAGFAEATAALMRQHGLDVSIATSGGDALKMAEECNPVLVLCDLTLPDMTGLDVVQALRARRGANDWLAVILSAMSANDLRDIENRTRTSDITLMLPKPLTSPILDDLIARLEALRPSVGSA